MPKSEILESAIDKIQNIGWCKGQGRKGGTWDADQGYVGVEAFCMVGALSQAEQELQKDCHIHSSHFHECMRVIEMEITATGFKRDPENSLCPVAQFNDDPHTTKEDVILVMKKAISRLEQ